jgi:DNA-binding XRE family transcriptional regulator
MMTYEPKSSRTKAGHTQAQAAEMLGVHKRTWEDWERGINAMPEYALRLYRHLAGIERLPFKAAS